MRDLFLIGFLGAMMLLAFRRPFLFTLTYAYIDIVAPQRLSYFLLNSIPISAILFVLAAMGYVLADNKSDSRIAPRQVMLLILLAYCAYTTSVADVPESAAVKWEWVSKALIFAIFLPLTLRTKLRIEALALFMVLSASAIIVTGGIKTVLSGGGYGVLRLLIDNNSGLYEGSIISTVAIAIIPLILWLAKYGTVFPPDWKVKTYSLALIGACLLIPIGTEARTGLVCIAVLAVLMLRFNRYRFFYAGAAAALALISIPFLPQSFVDRMETIKNPQADQSASTRMAVWAWTWEFAKDNPMGGGFDAYEQNKIAYRLDEKARDFTQDGEFVQLEVTDQGRAYHSSYFEMLGEQGYFGLGLWLLIHIGGIWRMEIVRRRYLKRGKENEDWVPPLALALQNGQIIYMVGSLFVGIAFQPFVYMLVAMQIGLDTYLARMRKREGREPLMGRKPPARPAFAG